MKKGYTTPYSAKVTPYSAKVTPYSAKVTPYSTYGQFCPVLSFLLQESGDALLLENLENIKL